MCGEMHFNFIMLYIFSLVQHSRANIGTPVVFVGTPVVGVRPLHDGTRGTLQFGHLPMSNHQLALHGPTR